jgi:enoyl-CoA hydratase/3-hydroxyacyl-CoA dehydrogenase
MTARKLAPPDVVAVLGSGNMGSGIAQACAQAGFTVRVRDLTTAQIDKGRAQLERMLDGAVQRKKMTAAQREEVVRRITFTTDLAAAVRGAALVIEAVFEDEAVKRALFAEVAPLVADDTFVVTNTSSLAVSRLAEAFPTPGRFAGLHFFYPAPVNKLLEIVGGSATDSDTLASLTAFGYQLRKIPIATKDSPGFAVNRFFVPYMNEAVRMAEEGLASLATIEAVGRELTGATNGPFEVMNLTGLPIALHAMESLERAFGPAYAPAEMLEEQVGRGAPWAWREGRVEDERKGPIRARFEGLLIGIAAQLVDEGVAAPEAVETGAVVGLRWQVGPFGILARLGLRDALARVQAFAARWGDAFPVAASLASRAERGATAWPLQFVRTERHGPVTWVLLDRPAVLNSLNSEVLRQLQAAFQALAGAPDVRVVVLAGAGPVFCAGADIAEMAAKGVVDGRAFGFLGQEVCRTIEEFPAPVIGYVEGYALGGGLEIALATDFIVAADGARLGLPEVTIGIHPGFGGASRLTRLIGRHRTKWLVYSGTPVSTAEAERLGFVVKVFPAASARAEVQALAETIASRAPLAIAGVKSVINRGMDGALEGSLRLEGESAGHTFATDDRAEGMRAFEERRPPKFQAR